MCKFCEEKKYEIKSFKEWASCNPYYGDPQVDYEGIRFILYRNGDFSMAAQFDGGYIGDIQTVHFNYCPMCGKKF